MRDDREFVLYWMIALRRTRWNFALDRAGEWAVQLVKSLVILEPLCNGNRWASGRMHRYVIGGMADYAAFFLSCMVAAAASQMPVRVELVDSNGLLPSRSTDRVFTTAFSFRSFLQKELPQQLRQFPRADAPTKLTLPALKAIPAGITRRRPAASARVLVGDAAELAKLAIDHLAPAGDDRGGSAAARRRLTRFLVWHLAQYHHVANDPDADTRSGQSPYLHFGQIAEHELFQLDDRHALDGRDPNTHSRILWRLGHYDRPWGHDRLSFGMVRSMSSENTRRKLSVTECLRQFAQHHATSSEGVPIRGERACSAAQQQHAADGATAPPLMPSVRRRTSAVAWPASVCVRRSIDSHSPEVCE